MKVTIQFDQVLHGDSPYNKINYRQEALIMIPKQKNTN